MTTDPGPPQLEAEALLRVLFAEHGTSEDAKSSLDALRADAREMEDSVVAINSTYLDGMHPFPDDMEQMILEIHTLSPSTIRQLQLEPFDWEQGINLDDGRRWLTQKLGELRGT